MIPVSDVVGRIAS